MTPTRKRSFERVSDSLTDEFVEDGTPVEIRLQERDVSLKAPAGRTGASHFLGSPARPAADESQLTELIAQAQAFGIAAPFGLLGHLHHPEARRVLLECARRVPARRVAPYAQALALAGGLDSVEIMRGRYLELAEMLPLDAVPKEGEAEFAVGLLSCALGCVALDPGDLEAARTVARIATARPSWWSELALVRASDLAPSVPSRAAGIEFIRRTLDTVSADCDLATFVRLARYLILVDQDLVLRRYDLERMNASVRLRRALYGAIRGTSPESLGLSRLVFAVGCEPDLRLALELLNYLQPLVDERTTHRLVVDALLSDSPTLRLDAIRAALALPSETRNGVLRTASLDEPDPLLRSFLAEATAA